jgi:homoserine kinase
MGKCGGLIAGLYTKDYDLIGRSLHDEIVEPLRAYWFRFWSSKQRLENGVLVLQQDLVNFALSKGYRSKIAKAMSAYDNEFTLWNSRFKKVNPDGLRIYNL